jgi:RNA polymerase sigma factor (sigma-70 family)
MKSPYKSRHQYISIRRVRRRVNSPNVSLKQTYFGRSITKLPGDELDKLPEDAALYPPKPVGTEIEYLDLIETILEMLSPEDRRILEKRYLKRMTREEVAKEEKITIYKMKKIQSRALNNARRRLSSLK